MSDIAIRVEGLGKKYRLGAKQQPYHSARDAVVRATSAPLRLARRLAKTEAESERATRRPEFWALKDVSFEVRQGEVLGVIGRNGAGKSTLLKILSEITEPTEGRITLDGRVASLLEVGTGFHPELSGRENIFLNGAILGMTRAEIVRKFDEIVAFAEVERFIDTQVKHYSSGMYLRLAFAVAAHLEPEILIVDEVLAVGDAAFQKKCMGKMGEVSRLGRTVMLVSHNIAAITNLCTKAVLLEGGHLITAGDVREIVDVYVGKRVQARVFTRNQDVAEKRAYINEVVVESAADPTHLELQRGEGVRVRLQFRVTQVIYSGQVVIQLFRGNGDCVFATTNMDRAGSNDFTLLPGDYSAECVIPGAFLREGEYYLVLAIHVPMVEMLDLVNEAVTFEVSDKDSLDAKIGGQPRAGAVEPLLDWLIAGPH